ncbi:MAG: hypothetical protein ACI9OJ_002489, partial [Myxococcota bacterium]
MRTRSVGYTTAFRVMALGLLVLVGCGEESGATNQFTVGQDELCHEHGDVGEHCHDLTHGGQTDLGPVLVQDTSFDADAGEPIIDCDATPGAFGCACTDNEQCNSGFCVPSTQKTNICTEICIENCAPGFSCRLVTLGSADATFLCIEDNLALCRPCDRSEDCSVGGLGTSGDRCVSFGESEGAFCGTSCDDTGDCPSGYGCEERPEVGGASAGALSRQCVPTSGECSCSGRAIADGASTSCVVGGVCDGSRACTDDGLTQCDAPEPSDEICDGFDNNCNGAVDEGFLNTDSDALPECLDDDDDADTVLDVDDNCPLTPNLDQVDTDNDGAGDLCDSAEVPVFSGIEPASPANQNAPIILGSADVASTVRLYANAFCAGSPVATAEVGVGGTFALEVAVEDNSDNLWTADATSGSDLASPCTAESIAYREDSLSPAAPVLASSDPTSPSQDTSFELSGVGEAMAMVTLWASADCTGDPVATVVVDGDDSFAISLVAPLNTPVTYSAAATDAASNASPCSAPFAFIHDDQPPVAPILDGTNPPSPSATTLTPTILGHAEPGSTVQLFANANCDGAPEVTTLVGGLGLFQASVIAVQNSETIWWANATDLAGNVSLCSSDSLLFLHDDVPPAAPVLTATVPTSPGDTNAPDVQGTAEPLALVQLYVKPDCTGITVGDGFAGEAGAFSVTAVLPPESSVTVYADATDALGQRSDCSAMGLTYQHDGQPPTPPVLTGTEPDSPGSAQTITVVGVSEPLSAISLFDSPGCGGTPVGFADVDIDGTFAATVTVSPNAQTALYGTTLDGSDNVSPCSSSALIYVHDNIAPDVPTLTGTNPTSPSSFLAPKAGGTAEAFAQVSLFPNADCSGLPIGQGVADATGTFQVTANVATNASTTITAHASDAAGNSSACSTALTYIHDATEPTVLVFTGTNPPSPSNQTTTPFIVGVAEGDSVVRLYADSQCSGSPVAAGTTDGAGAFSLMITAQPNSTSVVYGATIDGAGNVSPCSPGPAIYVHDNVAPAVPTLVSTNPESPSSTTNQPVVTGMGEPGASIHFYLDVCSGPPIATALTGADGVFSATVSVPVNASVELVARAVDAATNGSACSAPLVFTHDADTPGTVILSHTVPGSPATSLSPTVLGTAEAGSIVQLYQEVGCLGAVIASGQSSAAGIVSLVTPVGPNQVTPITATATDSAGNVSPCSVALLYTHDGLAPDSPVLGNTIPNSPATSQTPGVQGSAEPGTVVQLFADPFCSAPISGAGVADEDGVFAMILSVTVATNAETSIYASATDIAGNVSVCSPPLVYVHDDGPPDAPTWTDATPPSPSGQTGTPILNGSAEPGSVVSVYAGPGCSGSPLDSVPADVSGAFGAAVSVTANSTFTASARATDGAGNPSPCSAPTEWTHDNVAPKTPLWVGTLPASPAASLEPTVVGTTEPLATVTVFASPVCTGAPIASGPADENGDFSAVVSAGADQ